MAADALGSANITLVSAVPFTPLLLLRRLYRWLEGVAHPGSWREASTRCVMRVQVAPAGYSAVAKLIQDLCPLLLAAPTHGA
jgi:hypothetical protein